MNGLELQKAIAALWPRCKTIFLTGYNDFDYIQASLRSGAFDYVLKREEDLKIIQSVKKAVEAIAKENSLDKLLQDARNQRTQALPALRKEYLMELLQGEISSQETRSVCFEELMINLRADDDLILCMGRIDEWREDIGPGDKSLFMYCVNNIVEEHFSNDFNIMFVVYTQERFLWIMQPKTIGHARLEAQYIPGTIESIQMACKTFLKLSCSFIAGCDPCTWDHISAKFDKLNFQLARGLGLGTEILLSDGQRLSETNHEKHLKDKDISLLSLSLEQKDQVTFYKKFSELSSAVHEDDSLQSGTALALFYSLSSMFILFLNRRGLLTEMAVKLNLNKLLSIQEHTSWVEASQFFTTLADALFDWADVERGRETSDVVWRVNEFIKEHIGGDLSLARLSEIVYLTPFYLSRLYKQQTGRSLTEYIIEEKLHKAKEMLLDSSKKIYQIGQELGFESAPYFNRLFKKMMNMTPQDYRDSRGKVDKKI